ncbi:MAG: hypothetical protein Q8M20_09985 [Rhodocyclaceae bacterium]|nr:hypothetical protein [Rhodocyclaceae bacterium]MDZ4213571.1 hypothetical protein [Rhodocyclaceae bacterium]
MLHLFVDISAHGFGHLAQVAPVLNRLAEQLPAIQLTLRSSLPLDRLRQRIHTPFAHIAAASDFGYVMHDAVTLDLPATAAAYRAAHADFPACVATDAQLLTKLGVDAALTDVAYLPLASAAQAGLPTLSMCSLNWADLFLHYFGTEAWAAPIHAEILAAYCSAHFLRVTPGMPMEALDKRIEIGPIGTMGLARRSALREKVGADDTAHVVMVALGGIPMRLPIEHWPVQENTIYLVPAAWQPARADFHTIETINWPFVDLLRSVDAVVTKPGYGTFAEAAGNGTAVLYQRREDWPEQTYLIDWLQANARCAEISADALSSGDFTRTLDTVLAAAVPPPPTFSGVEQAACHIARLLV